MKELSIEEKAKHYDEALEIAKKNYDAAQDMCNGSQIGVECFKNTLTNIFPELKRLEDEKIRKALISILKSDFEKDTTINGISVSDIIVWLKKQCEINEDLIAKKFLINKGYPIDANGTIPTYVEIYDIIKTGIENQYGQSSQWNISDLRTWQYIVSDVLTKYNGIGQYLDNGLCRKIAKDMQNEWSKKLCLIKHTD